jgi:hypothetical protein
MNDLLLLNWITCLTVIRKLLLSVLIILIIMALVKYIKKM